MRFVALTVGLFLVLSGAARAGQPVPPPKAPLTTRGYKVPVVKNVPITKTYSVPKTTVVPVKAVLTTTPAPTIQTSRPGKPPVVTTTARPVFRVTRVKVRTQTHASLGHGSSISLLKAALLSGSTLHAPAVRRPLQVERRVTVRLQTRTRPRQHETSPQPSLLRTLQYQFDLVQMSEALGQ